MQTFTLKQIADRNGVSKSTVKAYASRNGYKPVDTTGSAYKYPADLMAVITEKYGEPANSKKLFNQAVANAKSVRDDALVKRVDQLIDYAGWWSELDDQRMVPVYFYRFILSDKSVQNDKRAVKIMAYFGGFSLDPKNDRLRDAVASGAFKSLVNWIYNMMRKPTDVYQSIYRWNKFSNDGKVRSIEILDDKLSKNYANYRAFNTGSNQGAGGSPLAVKKAESATSSEEPDAERCNSALLANQKKKGMEV